MVLGKSNHGDKKNQISKLQTKMQNKKRLSFSILICHFAFCPAMAGFEFWI
jgi:hypothetical protein